MAKRSGAKWPKRFLEKPDDIPEASTYRRCKPLETFLLLSPFYNYLHEYQHSRGEQLYESFKRDRHSSQGTRPVEIIWIISLSKGLVSWMMTKKGVSPGRCRRDPGAHKKTLIAFAKIPRNERILAARRRTGFTGRSGIARNLAKVCFHVLPLVSAPIVLYYKGKFVSRRRARQRPPNVVIHLLLRCSKFLEVNGIESRIFWFEQQLSLSVISQLAAFKEDEHYIKSYSKQKKKTGTKILWLWSVPVAK